MKRIITCLALVLFFSLRSYSQGTWVDLNINTSIHPLFSVYAVSNTTVWAGGLQGTVIKTTNEGVDWFPHGGGPVGLFDIYVVACIDSQTVLLGAQQQTPPLTEIFRTSTGGQAWSVVFSQDTGWIDDIKMLNASTGYAYGDPVNSRWTILRTSNGGQSWDSSGMYIPEPGGNVGWFNDMCLFNSGFSGTTIWFGTNDGLVYKSANGGFNWVSESIPMNGPVFSVVFADANNGFCGSDVAICGTNNGGTGWNLLSTPNSGNVNAFAFNSGTYWYVTGSDIIVTTDAGGSFAVQHTSPSGIYQDMSFELSPNANIESTIGGWAITGKSVISHYIDHTIGIKQISSNVPSVFKLNQNYPNPFNPSTKISFDIPHLSGNPNVELTIYDVTGKVVDKPVSQALSPGSYEVQWPSGIEVSSGIYFYRLNYSKFSETKKMILVK